MKNRPPTYKNQNFVRSVVIAISHLETRSSALGKMHSGSEFVTFTEQLRKNGHGDPPVLFHVSKENAILHNISNFEDVFICRCSDILFE